MSVIDVVSAVLLEAVDLFAGVSKSENDCSDIGCFCCCRTEQKSDDGTLSGLVVELTVDKLVEVEEASVIDDVSAVVRTQFVGR